MADDIARGLRTLEEIIGQPVTCLQPLAGVPTSR